MAVIADILGPVLLAALVVWYLGGPLLRLAAASCFLCAGGLVALGDILSAGGVAGCGLVCWAGGHLIYRARRGQWRSRRAAHPFAREPAGRGSYGGVRPPV